ncbi:MAG: response regulator, partial [Alphaproteobacteria bacterium]
APGRESVDQIGIAGRRARDLISQILTFSRSATREAVWQRVRPMVEEAVQILRPALPPSVLLREQLCEEPLAITLSPTEVQQLVSNLATNAAQALPDARGSISIDLARTTVARPMPAHVGELRPGVYAEITVTDTGCGINANTLSRLFEPFFTTRRRQRGTGLGLHVVHGIVTAHGGAIVVDSTPGGGTVFKVFLPASSEADTTPAVLPSEPGVLGGGERVAYLDDDEVVRLMVQRVLEHQGFDVSVYAEPRQLVETLAKYPEEFQLLITDYSMPGMNGLEVAHAVRAVRSDIPIIILTGYVPDHLRLEVAALGAAEVLNKENTFEELGTRAASALQGRIGKQV